tara:strand:+ start:712 stop:1614 length:903 start_codon:yes stop_codon:yes gene_type:complete
VEFNKNINEELFSSNPSAMVELLTISNIANSSDVIKFHGGVNEVKGSVFFNDIEYNYIPYNSSGFGLKTGGGLTRPMLKIINIDSFLSQYILDKDDLIGSIVTRTRTFIKFLDKVNFHDYDKNLDFWKSKGINPDPDAKLIDEKWIINRKTGENKFYIEYELTSPLDLENVRVPRRQVINNYCFWKYRGKGCGFCGDPVADANDGMFAGSLVDKGEWALGSSYSENDFVFMKTMEGSTSRKIFFVCITDNQSDADNKPTVDSGTWATDQCSKTLTACKMRFTGDVDDHLPFGGFPGSKLY